MTENKETVLQYLEGFKTNDHTLILSCISDDITWDTPGVFYLEGREAFEKEIENDYFDGRPAIEIIHIVEENNVVVVEGSIKCHIRNGGFLDALFCDVFVMEHGLIQKLTTYQMNKSDE